MQSAKWPATTESTIQQRASNWLRVASDSAF
jgi:hypothetical protein